MLKNNKRSKKLTLARQSLTATVAAVLSTSLQAQIGSEPDLEEIVVTGSFIRGSPLDAPSPVQIVDRQSIEAQGAAILWDVIKNLEANSGSFAEGGAGEVPATAGTSQVNLRNLGENSTLTLINGKRMVPSAALTRGGGEFVDLNAIPLVMTDRVEILTDGGSALYGADAVAGVVNIIMRNDFEGFELYGDVQNIVRAGSAFDATVSAIWGWGSSDGRTRLVLSAERFERDPVPVTKARFFDNTSLVTGNVSVPTTFASSPFFGANVNAAYLNDALRAQNLSEDPTATTVIYTDPLCREGLTDDRGNPFFVLGEDPRQRGLLGRRSGACVVDTSDWGLIAYEHNRSSFAGSFSYSFPDDRTELYSFFQASENKTIRSGSGYGRSFASTFLPSPGAYDLPRGQVFELGHFAPLFGNEVPVIHNNPADLANGGPNTLYRSALQYGVTRPGGKDDLNTAETMSIQLGMRGGFDYAGREFNWDVSYTAGSSSMERRIREFDRYRSHMASLGLGGPNCVPNGVADFDFMSHPGANGWTSYQSLFRYVFEGFFVQPYEPISFALTSSNHGQDGCMFYNPLLTSLTDPNVANSDELMEWISRAHLLDDRRNKLGVLDIVFGGELFEMRGGQAAFAVGAQSRRRHANSIGSPVSRGTEQAIIGFEKGEPIRGYIDNNLSCSSCSSSYRLRQDADAVFMELSLPFLPNVESQWAARWEDYGGAIGSEISPKVAFSWRPIDALLFRTSWSKSFRAPNPGIIGAGLDASSATFLDPLRNQQVRAGLAPPTFDNAVLTSSFTLGAPSPEVGNEYADTYSAGFQWTPDGALDGVNLQVDFWRFEVRDRVLPEAASSAMSRQLEAFSAAVANPANYVLNSSLDTASAADLFVPCNPQALEREYGAGSAERLNCVVDPRLYQVDGVEESLPSPVRNLIQLRLGAINAGTITADGMDLKAAYRWSTRYGQFRLSTDYTYVNQYRLRNVPGLENGLLDIGVFDAAGTTGDGSLVRSLPDHKANVTLNWSRDRHSITAINRFVGSYTDLTARLRYPDSNPYVRELLRETVSSHVTLDLQYRYTHDWGRQALGTTVFTVGLLDALDRRVPYRETGSLNYDATVFDGRGRRAYMRALWQF
jgi:iron complex outermembrane receptor protein